MAKMKITENLPNDKLRQALWVGNTVMHFEISKKLSVTFKSRKTDEQNMRSFTTFCMGYSVRTTWDIYCEEHYQKVHKITTIFCIGLRDFIRFVSSHYYRKYQRVSIIRLHLQVEDIAKFFLVLSSFRRL